MNKAGNRKQETGKRSKAQGSKLKAERKEKIGIGKEAGRMEEWPRVKQKNIYTVSQGKNVGMIGTTRKN
ncbi:MAG: hypothetical protein ACWGNI_06165 [Desulfobacterales bacterium]